MGNEQAAKISRYVLQNVTNRDVNIGDLRYTIPAKKSRDLLSKTAHLDYDAVIESKKSGSIFKKLGKSLIEVTTVIEALPPLKTSADPSIVHFPQRIKSSIVIDVSEISEDVQQEISDEETALLKQLEQSYEENVAPIVSKREDKNEKNAAKDKM